MKNFFKIVIIILILVYLLLYYSYRNGYYEKRNAEKNYLTEEKIKEYEEDLKKGIDVSQKNYIIPEESYDNKYTRLSLKISHSIENALDQTIKYLFRKMSDSIYE